MNKITRVVIPIVASAALALAVVSPAEAAASGGTSTSFTLIGGALDITVPASANLGSTYDASSLTVTGPLGAVTVNDNRAVLAAYTVTASSSAFANGASSVPNTDVTYTAGTVTKSPAGLSLTVPGATVLGLPVAVVTSVAILGTTTATWNPNLLITLPLTAKAAGTYTGTITHSVA
jgi:hypothetical protein